MAQENDPKTKRGWSVKQNPDEPGRYDCNIPEYEGHIQLPHPFMLNHLKRWWEVGVDPLKKLESIEWKYWGVEWSGGKMLLLDYGEWNIKGLSVTDVKNDEIPANLEEWVIACVKDYVLPQLDPKKRLVLLTIL